MPATCANSTHCLFLDFSKAFDTVPHQRLLLKLEHYGITGSLLKWFSAFLTQHRQRVAVNGCASRWASVLSSVPQGSILGPLLLILYVNSLSYKLNSSVNMFADDVSGERYYRLGDILRY